jgi:hypothetical protein
MAFFRFNRDKRGYEHFYLVEPTTNRRGNTKPRVLYWFRTPPGVRVGREPFDEGVRRALEAQNPGVTFDWRSIVDAPIPSADAEKWRERRRAERAAKAFARADVEEDDKDEADGDALADDARPIKVAERAVLQQAARDAASETGPADVIAADAAATLGSPSTSTTPLPDPARKRRRRRRGRRPGVSPGTQSPGGNAHVDGSPSSEESGSHSGESTESRSGDNTESSEE